jgi:hypothetical protein
MRVSALCLSAAGGSLMSWEHGLTTHVRWEIIRRFQETKYKTAAQSLGGVVETSLKQNVTMDVYEEYFAGAAADLSSEPPSAKGLGTLASRICLHRARVLGSFSASCRLVVVHFVALSCVSRPEPG